MARFKPECASLTTKRTPVRPRPTSSAMKSGLVGAAYGERSADRKTYRNGYRERTWSTRAGDIDLLIPKMREGTYFPSFLEPRRRAEQALMCAIRESYVQGVSTRRVETLCEHLGVENVDKSFVSRITKTLDEEITAFTTRRLEARFPYVYVDARYEKVRREGRIMSTAFLVAMGVREDGGREVLGFSTGMTESHALWRDTSASISSATTRFTISRRMSPSTSVRTLSSHSACVILFLGMPFAPVLLMFCLVTNIMERTAALSTSWAGHSYTTS